MTISPVLFWRDMASMIRMYHFTLGNLCFCQISDIYTDVMFMYFYLLSLDNMVQEKQCDQYIRNLKMRFLSE